MVAVFFLKLVDPILAQTRFELVSSAQLISLEAYVISEKDLLCASMPFLLAGLLIHGWPSSLRELATEFMHVR